MTRLTLMASLVLSTLLAVAGCGEKEPFSYVPVKGDVKYDDDSLIQADAIEVTFYPQSPPKDPKTHPRPGTSIVNTADGTFDTPTSHKAGDGVVPGKHKVTVQTFDQDRMPTQILPPEYSDPHQTPLEVDTADSPFPLRVRKK